MREKQLRTLPVDGCQVRSVTCVPRAVSHYTSGTSMSRGLSAVPHFRGRCSGGACFFWGWGAAQILAEPTLPKDQPKILSERGGTGPTRYWVCSRRPPRPPGKSGSNPQSLNIMPSNIPSAEHTQACSTCPVKHNNYRYFTKFHQSSCLHAKDKFIERRKIENKMLFKNCCQYPFFFTSRHSFPKFYR